MAHIPQQGALSPDTAYDPPTAGVEGVPAVAELPQYRADQIERAMFEIQQEQSLMLGTVAGLAAGAVGALVWAAVTVATGFQIGWLAIGIGCLVGAAVRWLGRGTTTSFGIIGGTIALVSVVVGNFLSLVGLLAGDGVSYLEMLIHFDYAETLPLMAATFSPMDLLFYGFAIWEGYQFSIRQVTPAEIEERLAGQGVTPAMPH